MAKPSKPLFLTLCCMAAGIIGRAQEAANEKPHMADALRNSGKIYVVVAVLLVILLGIAFYLVRLDRKISRMEKGAKF